MEIATNRLSCIIVLFVLFLEGSLAKDQRPSDVIERAHNNTASNRDG
jgi:hypothetical protein